MKKYLFLIAVVMGPIGFAFADFLDSTPVGPGTIHHHEFRQNGPWHIHILEFDLTNDWIYLETVKANDLLSGYERTSSMAARSDFDEHRVVGAINGDFLCLRRYSYRGTGIKWRFVEKTHHTCCIWMHRSEDTIY